jgi:hypothetical protein
MHRIGLVVAGGLVAGALDIFYAWAFWAIKAGASATRIFQSVATGVLGKAAFEGGAATAALGLTLHMLIAVAMSFAYYLVATRVPALVRRPLAFGAAYGAFLFAFMRFAVVPLSAAGKAGAGDPLWIGLTIVAHMVLVGIPIALFARRAIGGPRAT